MTIQHLPPELRGRPFSVGRARSMGLTSSDLKAMHLVAPTHGVRVDRAPQSLHEHCSAVAVAASGDFAFSHLTAARLHGLPTSIAMNSDPDVHVIRRTTETHTRRRGVRGHRGYEGRQIEDIDGLPVVGMADTWVDMGELIGPGLPVGLDDLIILGDAIATQLQSTEPLREALDRRVRPRGKVTLLEALDWIRVGSESPAETRTRLVLVRGGLPEPILNQPICTKSGRFVGRPDLKYEAPVRAAIEVQGRVFHSGTDERASDEIRHKAFGDEGYDVVPVWDDDTNSDSGRRELVLRVARILCFPESLLTLDQCAPRFFSTRMLELAERRQRRRQRDR